MSHLQTRHSLQFIGYCVLLNIKTLMLFFLDIQAHTIHCQTNETYLQNLSLIVPASCILIIISHIYTLIE